MLRCRNEVLRAGVVSVDGFKFSFWIYSHHYFFLLSFDVLNFIEGKFCLEVWDFFFEIEVFFLLTFVLRVSYLKLVSLVHYTVEQIIYFKRFHLRRTDRSCLLLSVSFPLEYSKRTLFFWDWNWAFMDGLQIKMKKKLWRKGRRKKRSNLPLLNDLFFVDFA